MASKSAVVLFLLQVSAGVLAQTQLRTVPHAPSPNAPGLFSRQDSECIPGDSLCPDGNGCCPTGVACITNARGPACDQACIGGSSIPCGGGCCRIGETCDGVKKMCLASIGGTIPLLSVSTPSVSIPSFTIPSTTVPTLAPIPGVRTTSTSSSASINTASTSTSSTSTSTSSSTPTGLSPDSTFAAPSVGSLPTSTVGDAGKPAPDGTSGGASSPATGASNAAGASMTVGGLLLVAVGAIWQALNLAL